VRLIIVMAMPIWLTSLNCTCHMLWVLMRAWWFMWLIVDDHAAISLRPAASKKLALK
jgi:hypothetical protein